MNEEQTLAEVKLAIMRTLRVISAPLLLPDTTLRAHVDIALPTRIPDATYNEAVAALKVRGYITGTPNELAGYKWALTDAGRVAAQEI
ncbi:hypothetical protein [Akkermansia glycaniphila]|uniref:Uncharacterized protein n=1 Tax=Akkermansia glycaniphila TaxID=1679444 RepID=A0A1C7PF56_9BACT|nr:hypothetical protein [Akkermansia glycaniphila]OCA02309.1 hypothetical protein AC781_10785 [Akkermansia glycaniphila]OCA04205.1 hypothetical protein AC781_00485 [Akkermansia glycaniphila]SEH87505.1 Hypothetical protein PYTT_1376 [Akkermansia glycaniphila]